MVNIMAFKIHNKYKYFIHFPKNPYLCKTNKQDRTMNNLLTHYPVNWIDGMKLSSSHFIAVQDFVTDSVRDAIALQTTDLNKEYKKNNSLPTPDFTTYLARDAHSMNYGKYGSHSPYRYGKNNEAPPGEYYLIREKPGQKHLMYLSDNGKSPYIKGILGHGERGGIAIHKYSPADAVGCLTTVSKDPNTEKVLLKSIKYWDNVKIILEEREVEESNWNNKNIGETKWTGKL